MVRSRFESRRRFVQGLAGGALVLASGRQLGWGAAGPLALASGPSGGSWGFTRDGLNTGAGADAGAGTGHAVLSGTDFQLEVGTTPVNFTGVSQNATVVNGQLPAPLLRWREGD